MLANEFALRGVQEADPRLEGLLEPLGEELWAVVILGTGVAIAAAMLLREADWAFGLVIIWAYIGIAMKQQETVAVIAALAGAVIVAVVIAYVLWRERGSRAQALAGGAI